MASDCKKNDRVCSAPSFTLLNPVMNINNDIYDTFTRMRPSFANIL